jgi:splicing factor 3A subunit 3
MHSAAKEIKVLLGESDLKEECTGQNDGQLFPSFYDQLRSVKAGFRGFSGAVTAPVDEDEALAELRAESLCTLLFSGEEMNGKYLDLHELHRDYVNVTGRRDRDYLDYVVKLAQFDEHDRKAKGWAGYVDRLLGYLCGFHERAMPLTDLAAILKAAEASFEEAWAAGKVAGWGGNGGGGKWCEACEHQFSSEATYTHHLTGKKHVKAAKEREGKEREGKAAEGGGGDSVQRRTALAEAKVQKVCECLSDQLEATHAYVQVKQTRTAEELEREAEDLERRANEDEKEEDEDDGDDDNKPIYNPLNIPLGFDGKPIPYWLYKLHGLSVEFKCEICGNYSYRGRRAFEKHFQEYRHQYGMKCLNIPNTKHFQGVTGIAEAEALYKKLKNETDTTSWNPDAEEFEDSDGNVLNKKIRDDLKRQGLL